MKSKKTGSKVLRVKRATRSQSAEVAVIMGSDSDWRVMKGACDVLKNYGIAVHTQVVSAHRTPQELLHFAESAREQGYQLIIAGAGGAAHLPGMVAALTELPVIGVPILLKSSDLDGLDSLLSIVQMPRGVPVATVAIDGAENAGLLAVQMLGIKRPALLDKIHAHKQALRRVVLAKKLR